MKTTKSCAAQREKTLIRMREETQEALKHVPDGTLVIRHPKAGKRSRNMAAGREAISKKGSGEEKRRIGKEEEKDEKRGKGSKEEKRRKSRGAEKDEKREKGSEEEKRRRSSKEERDGKVKKGNIEYYHRQHGTPGKEIYIPKANTELIQALAQKDYNQKVLRLIDWQLKEIQQCGKEYFPGSLDEVFNRLCEERQALVTPVEPTTEQYVTMWQNKPYEQSSFPIDPEKPNYTDRGEAVRSKSEVLIANALHHAGLPYKYECPLRLGAEQIRPDFTILNVRCRLEIYFEHFGMMDDSEYMSGFLWKMNLYEANGIFPGDGLIFTLESGTHSMDTRIMKRLIEQVME